MKCPECGSENVQIQLAEEGQQTNKKGIGFGGHIIIVQEDLRLYAHLVCLIYFGKNLKEQIKPKQLILL